MGLWDPYDVAPTERTASLLPEDPMKLAWLNAQLTLLDELRLTYHAASFEVGYRRHKLVWFTRFFECVDVCIWPTDMTVTLRSNLPHADLLPWFPDVYHALLWAGSNNTHKLLWFDRS